MDYQAKVNLMPLSPIHVTKTLETYNILWRWGTRKLVKQLWNCTWLDSAVRYCKINNTGSLSLKFAIGKLTFHILLLYLYTYIYVFIYYYLYIIYLLHAKTQNLQLFVYVYWKKKREWKGHVWKWVVWNQIANQDDNNESSRNNPGTTYHEHFSNNTQKERWYAQSLSFLHGRTFTFNDWLVGSEAEKE